jgi:DNA polymerase-3 subunit beta
MELTITRGELLSALYVTQGIVERRTTIPILGNVLIQSAGDGVLISATDQEISVRRRCTASVKGKGMLTAGARKLYEMVREFPEGDVRICSLENDWIEVSAGRSRFRLVGLDPREFPAMPGLTGGEKSGVHIASEMLGEMIEKTIFAVSADETRANLGGIYLETVETGRLRMVATDGHRLALVTRTVEGASMQAGIVIPRKAVVEIRKVIEGAGGPVDFSVAAGVAHIERGPVQMSMRLAEGEFPDYHQVVPAASERVVVIDAGPLLAALRRVSIVSSERTRGVKLLVDQRRIELSSINPDVGEASEEIEVEYDGAPLGMGFNARYLIDVLSILPADTRVELALNDDVSPGVLRPVGDPDYRYIVMPMRLS